MREVRWHRPHGTAAGKFRCRPVERKTVVCGSKLRVVSVLKRGAPRGSALVDAACSSGRAVPRTEDFFVRGPKRRRVEWRGLLPGRV